MMNEAIASVSSISSVGGEAATSRIELGYGASLTDVSAFGQSMNKAAEKSAVSAIEPSDTAKAALKPLDFINNEAASLADFASSIAAKGENFSPADIMQLTTRSQEFMFHCQLTSNIANRTSDGLQQLFRQQG
jgi:hypothetical protein